jgi:hypothetical protein
MTQSFPKLVPHLEGLEPNEVKQLLQMPFYHLEHYIETLESFEEKDEHPKFKINIMNFSQ